MLKLKILIRQIWMTLSTYELPVIYFCSNIKGSKQGIKLDDHGGIECNVILSV